MEVKLDKQYPVPVSAARAWAVLADIRSTAACMPGAQIVEQLDDARYKGLVKSKVGPAVLHFSGEIEVLELDPDARRLQMRGKGADKAGSSASMTLTARIEPGDGADSAVLVGQAVITVSGKLAQFGSRLLVPVSDAMLAQFADNFRHAAAALADAASPAEPAPGSAAPAVDATAALPPAEAPRAALPVRELNALALLWTVLRQWLAGLARRTRS
ncbi:MAG TPA: SRPBCC family protein [Methylibium sp.]|nr:SRPBCC family protein [Methylibium sp.]